MFGGFDRGFIETLGNGLFFFVGDFERVNIFAPSPRVKKSFGENLFVGVCLEKAEESTGAVDGRWPPTLAQRLECGDVISKLDPLSFWTNFL